MDQLSTTIFPDAPDTNKKDYELTIEKQKRNLKRVKTSRHVDDDKKILSKDINDHYGWISWWYLLRFTWRVLDVSSRIFICTFMWIMVGGTALTVIIVFESLFVCVLTFKTKQWELLFGIVALVISFSDDVSTAISYGVAIYRTLSNWIIMILISIWMFVAFECPRCTDYEVRTQLAHDPALFGIFIYCWICTVFTPGIMISLLYFNIFESESSLSRDIDQMIKAKNFNGIIEIQLYSRSYDYYDEIVKRSLLMLAMRQKCAAVVSHLLEVSTIKWDKKDNVGFNILDFYCQKGVDVQQGQRSMASSLLKIFKRYPQLKDRKGRNAFLCGCVNKEPNIVDVFSECDKNILYLKDHQNHDFTFYLFKGGQKLKGFDSILFYERYPSFSEEKFEYSPFFYECETGNSTVVETLLQKYKKFMTVTNNDGDNVLDFYVLNRDLLSTATLLHIHQNYPDITNLNSGGTKKNVFLCAVYVNDIETVNYFIKNTKNVIHSVDEDGKNMFDYSWFFEKHETFIKQHAIDFYKNNPESTNKNGQSFFHYACEFGEAVIVQKLIESYPELIDTKDAAGFNVLDYYLSNPSFLSTSTLITIHKKYPKLKTNNRQMTIFLCACYHGEIKAVDKIIQMNKEVLKDKNADGYNGSSIAKIKGNKKKMENHLKQKYQLQGKKPDPEIITRVLNEANLIKKDKYIKKVIILGSGQTGKSTFFKQLRAIYGVGYDEKDRLSNLDHIHAQLIEQMKLALEWVEDLEEEKLMDEAGEDNDYEKPDNFNPYASLSDEGQNAAKVLQSPKYPKLDDEITQAIVCLWNEEPIKNIYDERAMMKIEETSAYFWDKIEEINTKSYIPSEQDIMLVRYRITGVDEQRFNIKKTIFHTFVVGGQISERKKWIHCFESVTAVMYFANLNSFDSVMFERSESNMMTDSLQLFDKICNNSWFEETNMILCLNQKDLFAEKIKTVPITVCDDFADYEGDTTSFDETTEYIKNKFLQKNANPDKPVFCHLTCAIDKANVEMVFNDVQHIIIESSLMSAGLMGDFGIDVDDNKDQNNEDVGDNQTQYHAKPEMN